jgi:hypothetical protein
MFNQKVFTLLGMWLNGRVLPCHAQGPGFNLGHQEKKMGRRGGGEREDNLQASCQALLTNTINRILYKVCNHQYPKTTLSEKQFSFSSKLKVSRQ